MLCSKSAGPYKDKFRMLPYNKKTHVTPQHDNKHLQRKKPIVIPVELK